MEKNTQENKPVAVMNQNVPTVLVVEDDIGLNHLIRKTLEREGFKTHQALNGAEAIAAVVVLHDTVVLLDYFLPDMTGKQIIMALREKKIEMPLIIMTGRGDERIAVEIMKLGVCDYIVKEQGFVDKLPKTIRQTFDAIATEKEMARLEKALRQSEASYRILFEQAADIILQLEITPEDMPVIREANGAALRLLGYERDELIGKPVTFINVAPDDSKIVVERRQNVLSGIGTVFEARHRCKDGTIRDFECSAAEMQVGAKTFAITVERDVTERKRIEEVNKKTLLWREGVNLLQQSLLAPAPLDRKLKNITDSIVRIFDADFCRVWLIRPGDRCEQGCVHAEVKEGPHVCRYRDRCLHLLASSGRYAHTDGKGHSRVPFGCYKIGLVASGEEHKFITNDVRNDPRVHNHEWAREQGLMSFAGYQVRVPGGQTMGVLALFAKHSITPSEDAMIDGLSSTLAILLKQDEAENALRESEQRYRTLFDDATDGIVLADSDTGRIVECNQALCQMVERDKAELLGQMQSILHPPQSLANEQSATFVQHKTGDPGMTVEDDLISKSGTLIPVEIKASRLRMNGREYMLGIFRDISKRKLLEKEKTSLMAQLLQAQKMEAVGTLAGGVAHDFNNLLTAINGYISLAMIKIDESDPVHRDLKQAGIAAGRAGNVVRQLLLFSRKQPAVELFSLNFNDIVNNLLKMLRRLIGEDVAINTELAPDLWTIKGDEGNIE